MLVALWALMHRNQGVVLDGKLYAVQALQKLDPTLHADVYLQNTSQDRYTIFSSLYAAVINCVGLERAQLLLMVLCSVSFIAASWVLARELSNAGTAWLATSLLIISVGYYGANTIFHISERYLTARSLAEVLVITALACHFRGWRRTALVISISTFLIHPIMALPGLLLLICLRFSILQSLVAASAAVAATFLVALTDTLAPASAHFLAIIDAPWLEVVRERSQFLFLNYWSLKDWEINVRPLLSVALSALVIDDKNIRRLCAGAAIVGAAGLAVAFIAGAVGPVAILLQGQAWRWIWITSFVAILLVLPTALRAWPDRSCGPLCATLMVLAWTFPVLDGAAAIALAYVLWSLRSHLGEGTGRYLRWAAFALASIAVAWAFASAWTTLTSAMGESGREPEWVARVRAVFSLQIPALLFVALFWYAARSSAGVWAPLTLLLATTVLSALILPGALKQVGTNGTAAEIAEFAEWRSAIPPASNVLIVPTAKAASFAWFTLGRPSYISLDQSAGVVFSRETALEIQRRSEVVLPIADPDWQVLKLIQQAHSGKKPKDPTRPLTAAALIGICNDLQSNFVVAKENVGFEPLRHAHAGAWKDWNLYDCRRVRAQQSTL